MRFRVFLIFGGLLLLFVAFMELRERPVREAGNAQTPIDFTLQDLNGKPVRLADYRGKVVVIDMWTTWCGYCVEEIPDLIDAQRKASASGMPVQYLGIAMDENIADVRAFAAKQQFNYPILYKDAARIHPLGEVEAYPTKFIIDKQGHIVDKIVGAVPVAEINQRVAKYLQTP